MMFAVRKLWTEVSGEEQICLDCHSDLLELLLLSIQVRANDYDNSYTFIGVGASDSSVGRDGELMNHTLITSHIPLRTPRSPDSV